jgi:hypothetical protein
MDVPIPDATFVAGPALTGTYDDIPWTIKPGDLLNVDVGPLQEKNLLVQAVTPGVAGSPPSMRLTFQKPHTGPLTISPANVVLGNPGPQPNYDPRHDAAVVRYLSIIE